MSDHQKFPSTAHYDGRGQYQHDPENQLLAEQEKQGLTGPQPFANRPHISKISGYCSHGQLGGCALDPA